MHYCGLEVSTKSTLVYIQDQQERRVRRTVAVTPPEGLTATLAQYARRGLRVAIEPVAIRRGSATCFAS
jgi:hypothetical protein